MIAVLALAWIAGGCATVPATPRGEATPELAVQVGIGDQLGMRVTLQVETFATHGEWAFLAGLPLTAEGGRIDYLRTPFADQLVDGYFDDNFAALVRRSAEAGGGWHIVEMSIGATDAPFIAWPDQHGLPMSLVSPGSSE